MEHEPQTPSRSSFAPKALAWVSVGCGVGSWLLAIVIPVGVDLAGIIVGLLAIYSDRDGSGGARRIAIWGVVISGAKLLAMIALFAWVIISFAINPVAH